jgi:hypothetical protein
MAIALVLYGGNEEQKAKLENNAIWHKARLVFDYGLSFGSKIIGTSLEQSDDSSGNAALIDDIDNQVAGIVPTKNGADSEPGFWSGLGDKVKEEWDKGTSTPESSLDDIDQGVGSMMKLDWQKTENGAEIVFRTGSGAEHRLSLPFKFLGR